MDFKNKYLKYKKKYVNLKRYEMVGSGKEEWVPKKYFVQDNRIWVELHKIDEDTKETKDIMFIYRSNSGLLWHMYTSKNFVSQVPKIEEIYSTSYLLDLSLQKKINFILDNYKDSIEKMDSKHNIPESKPSRFSFTTYYTDTMRDFLKLQEEYLRETDLWDAVTKDEIQYNIVKIFQNKDDDDDKDLLFIRENIFGKYPCPSLLQIPYTYYKVVEVEDKKFTKEIYNTYNKEISKILNDYFIIDDKSEKICHFTTESNKIEFYNYDDERIKQTPIPWTFRMDEYAGIFEATIEYSVNSIKIKSRQTQKDFHLVYMNYNFKSLEMTDKGKEYELNEEIFKKEKNSYNAPLFLTDDLSSLNSRYPVYNKIIPMGIYTCKIFEYHNQVKGNFYKGNFRPPIPYLFLGNYMNNMWPFNNLGKYINESECDQVMNIPSEYINKIEELEKNIEELNKKNTRYKEDCLKLIDSNEKKYNNLLTEYHKKKNELIEKTDALIKLQKEYNELFHQQQQFQQPPQ